MFRVALLLTTVLFGIPVAKAADTPRTKAYLLGSAFQDGQPAGSITPSDMRDFVVSTYPSSFRVTGYGAKCDAATLDGSVTVTSGSPTISSTAYAFTATDVGATIDLFQAPFNSHSISVTSFNSTIVSVSGGNATLAANATFGWGGSSARWYHTVDTTTIQAAIDAASSSNTPGGGVVEFPPGGCATGNLTLKSNIRIVGAGENATVLMLANGSNSDMFTGQNFASLTGTENTGGIHDFSFENILLDGNRGANTGSGSGTATGTGDGVRIYGYQFHTDHVFFNNFAADGWYSEWSNTAGNPLNGDGTIGPGSMVTHMDNTYAFYNSGVGIVFAGPHDSYLSNAIFSSNGVGGLYVFGLGTPVDLSYVHMWQNGSYDADFAGPFITCNRCYFEGTSTLEQFSYAFLNSNFGTLNLGVLGGGNVYTLNFINTNVTTLNNVTGINYQTGWVNGSIGTITGNAYAPNALQTTGVDNNLGSGFKMINGSSYPTTMAVSGSSVFTMSDSANTFFMDAGSDAGVSGNFLIGASSPLLTMNVGELGFSKITASGTAPGSAGAKLAVVCGTTSGKAKLIMYAGTSTTPVTVLDNVGSGVSGC